MHRTTVARPPPSGARRALAERLEPRALLAHTLSGFVYDDLHADGRTPNDLPLPGQAVELLPVTTGDPALDTAVTGADGRYAFTNVPDGDYRLRLAPTPDRFGPYVNPDVTHYVSLPSGAALDAFDFGSTAYASVSGVAYHDLDRDGTRGPGEPPAADQAVFIDYDFSRTPSFGEPTTTTGPDGAYRFDRLRPNPGRTRVTLQPADGWLRTAPPTGVHEVPLASGADVADLDFGVAPRPALSGLTLINAGTDQPVGPLVHGATINLADFRRGGFGIRADLAPGILPRDVGSVRFNLDGDGGPHADNSAPYSASDIFGDSLPLFLRPGTHTLVATPYSADNGGGDRGAPTLVTFNVVNGAPNPAARPVRVNAGGRAYLTRGGDLYTADTGFHGGSSRSTPFAVAGTDDDLLYSSHRTGPRMIFNKVVPAGRYTLRLHFAEPAHAEAGRRVFDVFAEGGRVLDDYDIAAEAGRRTAVVKEFTFPVDRRLDLVFLSSRDSAVVSAIELLPAAAAPEHPGPLMIDAGGPAPLTDSVQRVFDPDSLDARGFVGGSAVPAPFDVADTTDDALFSSHRAGGAFALRRPVANGNYSLLLGFAEPVAGAAAGSRTFDVFAEGKLILDNFDVTAAAGAAQAAVARAFDVSVADGSLDLTFRGVAGDAIVSSVVLLPTDVPDAARPYSWEALSEQARRVVSASNQRMIGQAVQMYANEHKGALPDGLERLVPRYLQESRYFASPRTGTRLPRGELTDLEDTAWVAAHDDYVYVGAGLTYRDFWTRNAAEIPIAYENPRKVAGPVNVLFADGHVAFVPREEAAAMIGFDPAPPTQTAPPPPDPTDPRYRRDQGVLAGQANLRALGEAMQSHAQENRGFLPADLARLFEAQTHLTLDQFLNPREATQPAPPPPGASRLEQAEWVLRHSDYTYAVGPGRYYTTPGDVAVAWEHPAEMEGGINLLFADGRVEFREMRWAIDTIRRSTDWTRPR